MKTIQALIKEREVYTITREAIEHTRPERFREYIYSEPEQAEGPKLEVFSIVFDPNNQTEGEYYVSIEDHNSGRTLHIPVKYLDQLITILTNLTKGE